MNGLSTPMSNRSRSPSPVTTNRNNLQNLLSPLEDFNGKRNEKIPLIHTENINPRPPLADSENDDIDSDDRVIVTEPYPGIDDGFFIGNRADFPDDTTNVSNNKPIDVPNETPRDVPHEKQPDEIDGKAVFGPQFPGHHAPHFPYAPGFGVYDPETGTVITDLESIPDVNVYQHKKTLAQGMMDLALFSANANQLRYVLESYARHPYYYPSVILISISLMFQVAVGVGLIWNSRYNVKDKKEICIANKINNFTVIGIFLVTVINVFISAFGVANINPVT